MTVSYSMRPAQSADAEFLYALNRETVREYVARTWGGWDEAFQTRFFAEHFEPSQDQIIVVDERPIGLLSVAPSADHHFIRALQISGEWQSRGIGTAIMRQLSTGAHAQGVPLELQVLKVNSGARRLYERLGFRTIGETATHVRMRDSPSDGPADPL